MCGSDMIRPPTVVAVDREQVESGASYALLDGMDPSLFVELLVVPRWVDLLDFPWMSDHDSHASEVLSFEDRGHGRGEDRAESLPVATLLAPRICFLESLVSWSKMTSSFLCTAHARPDVFQEVILAVVAVQVFAFYFSCSA